VREGGWFGERFHVKRMNHGQWRVMEVWEEEVEMMMVKFAEEEAVGL